MPAVFECRDNGRVLRLHNDSAFKLIWWRQIMAIMLQDIWNIENLEDYKVHFARWNGEDYPLDVWLRDRAEWEGWQKY